MPRLPIAVATHPYLTSLIAAGLGGALIGAALIARPEVEHQVDVAPITIVESPRVALAPVVVAEPAPPAVRSKQVALVFSADGATYMKLASGAVEAMPRHGRLVRAEGADVETVVADVAARDLAAVDRAWLGKRVTVDGTCTAKVIGFAVVSRLVGDPSYAGIEAERWTSEDIAAHGDTSLVARLDNCAGGTLARDASLPPMAILEEIDDPALVARAKATLLASRDVRDAQAEWTTAEQPGRWYEHEYTETTTHVLRHPRTGTTWVSVHLYFGGGCGLPNPSVWGLYRVDAAGKLVRESTQIGELTKIEELVDLDDDGEPEVVGRPWLGVQRTVRTLAGTSLQDLTLPFFFCPC